MHAAKGRFRLKKNVKLPWGDMGMSALFDLLYTEKNSEHHKIYRLINKMFLLALKLLKVITCWHCCATHLRTSLFSHTHTDLKAWQGIDLEIFKENIGNFGKKNSCWYRFYLHIHINIKQTNNSESLSLLFLAHLSQRFKWALLIKICLLLLSFSLSI